MVWAVKQLRQITAERSDASLTLVSHNLGTPAQQTANGTPTPDPVDYVKRTTPWALREETAKGDKVFAYVLDNNHIADPQEQGKFTTFDDLARRVADRLCVIRGADNTPSNTINLILEMFCVNNEQFSNGRMNGTLTFYSDTEFTANLGSNYTRAEDDGAANAKIQTWIMKDLTAGFSSINFSSGLFTGATNLTANFDGTANFGRDINNIYNYLDPAPDTPITYPAEHAFLAGVQFWEIARSKNEFAFLDTRPSVITGRAGAVALALTSDKPFDSVALVNCECLEAEVAGNFMNTCRVHGVDTTPSNSSTNFIIPLTCIGNAPSVGTGDLDGVITLRSDTRFTWDGMGFSNMNFNPLNLMATRAPNDGANDAMVQRWIVKGAVLNFTKIGQIGISNAVNETNFTGSFEGVVSYEGNTTITLSPDAPHEPSDLLFTDLQPIANDAGIYTATINIKADTGAIPTASQSAGGRAIASIGQVIVGARVRIGNPPGQEMIYTGADYSQDLIQYTDVSRNSFGEIVDVATRPTTYSARARVLFNRIRTEEVKRAVNNLLPSHPTLFYESVPESKRAAYGDNGVVKQGLFLYGKLDNVRFSYEGNDMANCELTISGLV